MLNPIFLLKVPLIPPKISYGLFSLAKTIEGAKNWFTFVSEENEF